jgi:hypothetical protein
VSLGNNPLFLYSFLAVVAVVLEEEVCQLEID